MIDAKAVARAIGKAQQLLDALAPGDAAAVLAALVAPHGQGSADRMRRLRARRARPEVTSQVTRTDPHECDASQASQPPVVSGVVSSTPKETTGTPGNTSTQALVVTSHPTRSPSHQVLDSYIESFCSEYGEEPVIAWGRDGKIAKGLIAQYGLDKVLSRVRLYPGFSDDFYAKQTHPFTLFPRAFTALRDNGNRARISPKTAANLAAAKAFTEGRKR